jgi:predicted CopG family antitoxin
MMEHMETITISKKEYRTLKQAKAQFEALSNVKRNSTKRKTQESFADLVGALSDVKEFKGKTSVEVQHMIRDLWTNRTS